jgi:hypothetical protein
MALPKFLACTIKHSGMTNKIITRVKICQAFHPTKPPSPPYPFHEVSALWDTGATNSVITKATVTALSLIPTGVTEVHHAGGRTENVNTYMVNFILPNTVGVYGVRVSECSEVHGNAGAIIGMDIICTGDFSITNVGGKTCMSFRTPSIDTIDYVQEAQRLKASLNVKIGRNDPCHCGSGKKYKKCHGK